MSSLLYVFQAAGNAIGEGASQNGFLNAALGNNVKGTSFQRGSINLVCLNNGGHQVAEGWLNVVVGNSGDSQKTKGFTIAIANKATEEQNFDGQTIGLLNSAPKQTAAPGSIVSAKQVENKC
ncbi:hypothetical protein Bhyg_04201 [Pseudolycoriella hygida]|uniref:Uncharacterized protein n=1 Tax=Pseudolycoriella hygida TaxID=35572 RepID=A0A9Q0S860_9DIPT|nr:hypothetical protein Bhyg_04201 [Pseudolycoriella hygida]